MQYYNGTSWTFTWSQGRRLATASGNGYVLSFTYNDEGIRTTKTVDGIVHTYRLNGDQIVAEEWTTNGTQHVIVFLYDAEGSPIGMQYRNSLYPADQFSSYWFEKNLQGDIVAVYDAVGTKLISYTYDAWGNFATTYRNGCTESSVANYNPFRYRGYYYDTELEMYYLQSRYYDSVIGRFINSDGAYDTHQGLLGYNMYVYCLNKPVLMRDLDGRCGRFLGFLWKTDCKKASCPDSKYYVEPKEVDPVGTYNNGRGYVYIVTEDQLDIFKECENNVVVILDKRTNSDPNMQIQNSHVITKKKQQEEIAKLMLEYNSANPVEPAWERSLDSLVEEWRIHNTVYGLGFFRKNTKDCDFNNNDEGKGYWDFFVEKVLS